MNMNWTGYTLWARQTLESDVFKTKPDKWFKIFFFLVMRANHKDNEQWKRGEAHTSYAEIVEYTGANKNEIDHCIRWLKDRRMLATRKATRGFHFTIIKYGQYQDSSHYKATPKAIEKRHRSDTIKNNDKNDKKDSISTSVSDETNDMVSSKELVYVSDLEEFKKPKRATASREPLPFSLKAERDKLLNSGRRINHIVGLYLEVLGNTFPANSHIQFRTLLKRHYADAKHLVDFTDGQIKDAMAKCEKDSDMGNKWKWTLGTVLKYISK